MELRDYLNVISVRRWVIIQAVVVVTLTAVVVSLLQPKVYQGEAKVLINERDTGAALLGTTISEYSSQPERGLQTQVELMQLRPLAETTVRKLGLKSSPDGLLSRVDIQSVGLTNIVIVRVTAGDPKEAASIANTMAEEYVAWSRETKRESLRNAADEVESRLSQAENQILELGQKISAQGRSDDLAAELTLLTNTYSSLADRLEQLRINEQLEVGTGRVVSPAAVSYGAISPRPVRNGILGACVGLALGLIMALLYEYLDDAIASNEDAERTFGVPVLGTIPVERLEKGASRRLAIVEAPSSATAESYRVLRNSLDFINFERKLKTLLVTSAAPAEGKSTVTANLAASLAQAGKKVVLISSDFRRPTTEQFFGVSNVIGLSDVLLGSHTLKAALQRPGDEQLLVLTSGKMPPNPSELLGSEKMHALVEELRDWADWIVIDTPPLLAVADPAAVARWVDGVLVVTQAGRSTREASKKAIELLEKVGARLVGVVVWGLQPGRSVGYGRYFASGHYYAAYHPVASQPLSGRASRSAESSNAMWSMPPVSPGRRLAAVLGRILGGLLAFLAVLAVASAFVYFLDQYFEWGLALRLINIL